MGKGEKSEGTSVLGIKLCCSSANSRMMADEAAKANAPVVIDEKAKVPATAWGDAAKQMLQGDVDEKKMDEIGAKFASFYADKFAFSMSSGVVPSEETDFRCLMKTLGPYWAGFKYTDTDYTIKAGSQPMSVVLTQTVATVVAIDSKGKPIAGTESKGPLEFIHELTFNDDSKIIQWDQKFDAAYIEFCRLRIAEANGMTLDKSGIFLWGEFTFETEEDMKVYCDTLIHNRVTPNQKVGDSVEAYYKTGPTTHVYIGYTTADRFLKASGMQMSDFQGDEKMGQAFAKMKTVRMEIFGDGVNKAVKEAMEPWTQDPRIKVKYTDPSVSITPFKAALGTNSMLFINTFKCCHAEQADGFKQMHRELNDKYGSSPSVLLPGEEPYTFRALYLNNNLEWMDWNQKMNGDKEMMEKFMKSFESMESMCIGDIHADAQAAMEMWKQSPNMEININPDNIISSVVHY